MTTAELKEYLAMIVQTEKEVNLQEQLCQKINRNLYELDQSIITLRNRIGDKTFPSKPVYKKESLDIESGCSIIIFYIVVVCIVEAFGFHHFGLYFGIALAGLFLYCDIADKKHKEKSYKQKLNEYDENCAAIQNEKDSLLVEIEELKVQKQAAEAYRQQVETSLASSRRNLEKMYSYNVVFPKYRNYIMVSSLYEYLCAGRCTTLEGHEGAYNILELEIRLDRISTRLDRILQNLAAIQANQYTLYSCLLDSNQKIDMLLREESRMADGILHLGTQASTVNARLENLQRSSELTSYLTECNQRELHYMNRMNYLAGLYDNPYGNYSPV